MTPHDQLAAARVELDRAFAPWQERIDPVEGCDHCFGPEHLELLAGPVSEIPEWLFSRALSKWSGTLSKNVLLWRRLTPRVLRSLTGGTLHIDESFMARQFLTAEWRAWPEEERRAVAAVCDAWWAVTLSSDREPHAAVALEFLAPMTSEIDSWLEIWSNTTGPGADSQLIDLWATWRRELTSGDLDLSFSGELPNVAPQVSAFVFDQIPRRGLEDKLDGILIQAFAYFQREYLTMPDTNPGIFQPKPLTGRLV